MEDITNPGASHHDGVEMKKEPVSVGRDFEVLQSFELPVDHLAEKTFEIVLKGTHFKEVLSQPQFEDYFMSLEINLGLEGENLQPIKVEGRKNEIEDMVKDQLSEIIERDELIGSQKIEYLNVNYYYHPMAQFELEDVLRTDVRSHHRKLVSKDGFGPKTEG